MLYMAKNMMADQPVQVKRETLQVYLRYSAQCGRLFGECLAAFFANYLQPFAS